MLLKQQSNNKPISYVIVPACCLHAVCSLSPGAVGIEDMSFQSQRSNIVLRASMSPLVKPSLMPVKTSPGSDVGSPFSSPALSYKMGVVDVKSPWHGSVQSPHVVRRGPKLWTSLSGRDSSTAISVVAW